MATKTTAIVRGDYAPLGQQEGVEDDTPRISPRPHFISRRRFWIALVTIGLVVAAILVFLVASSVSIPIGLLRKAYADQLACPCLPPDVPQHFQTSPQLYAGPTPTGQAPFLAQTVAFEPSRTYVPNDPLRTAIPIQGVTSSNENIFEMMGYLSPYVPSPGFGVDEYPLPPGANIVQLQARLPYTDLRPRSQGGCYMLSRHGSRYPTSGSDVERFAKRIAEAKPSFKANGALSFLNDWEYQLGAEILVPKGRLELYNSGVLHAYMYSKLYNPNSKIIVRTTSQDRMLKSAENFLAGFFGLEWTNNATIEVIIEQDGFNNSLAGYLNCPNSGKGNIASQATSIWKSNYLQNATARFQAMVQDYDWTVEDSYAAQMMCPYETVAYGYSVFCDLFNLEEWVGFSYSIDLLFAGGSGFQNPTGRAVGIGYQQEVMARLKNHTLGYSGSQINVTLDNNTDTFPLNQSLYLDFSHDTNIASILTAFGLRQFAKVLPPNEYPGKHEFTVSHITPFGARLDMEIIQAPKPVASDRSGYLEGEETKYIHFVLNQRTLPLGASFPECGADRKDGWCELETFIKVQESMEDLASYDYACFGDYPTPNYGDVVDGRPPTPAAA